MSLKKHILPIFLLYFITSFLFLLLFINLLYTSQSKLIRSNSEHNLTHLMAELNYIVKNGEDILSYKIDDKIKIYIKDLNKNQILINNIEVLPKINKNLEVIDKNIYIKAKIHTRRMINNYEIIMLDTSYNPQIKALLTKLSFVFVFVFLIFSVIGYFIIRLSLRPLFDKIKSLNSFIEDATHEINTPLSVILMSTEMFEINPKKYLENIKTASKSLSNLYNDLVSLNLKIEPNSLTNLNLKEFLLAKLDYFEVLMSRKNLKFDLNLDECLIKTDINKIDKILDNLISNAIKYSDENETIKINLDKYKFEIQNLGEEIKSENLKVIFDKFSRFSKSETGFGIGLSLVKKYSDELDYKILCKSNKKITKFILKFN